MSQTKKTYSLSKIKQLIDLNGDSTNFNIKFKVTCKDNSPFQVLVVDQTTLDNTETLEYKDVTTGVISGNVIADKNVFQNHFLILKSDNQCEVDVEIIKEDLPKTPDSIIQQQINTVTDTPSQSIRQPSQGTNWLKIGLIALVIIGGGLLLWYLYKRNNPKTLHNDSNNCHQIKNSFSLLNNDNNSPIIKSPINKSPINNSPINNSPVNKSPVNKSPVNKSPVNKSPINNSSVNNSSRESFYKPLSYKETDCENKTLSNLKPSKNTSPDIMSHMSSERSVTKGASTLLQRLRKFAR